MARAKRHYTPGYIWHTPNQRHPAELGVWGGGPVADGLWDFMKSLPYGWLTFLVGVLFVEVS